MTGAVIAATALSWLGTPYRHQASVKGVGCDCIGLIGGVAGELCMASGLAWAKEPHAYGRIPEPSMLLAACAKYLDAIAVADAGVGDILLFRWDQEPAHFGVIVKREPLRIVHAYHAARKVCETGINGYWREGKRWADMICGAYRYRELA